MAKRGPKKRPLSPSLGIEPLKSQNIMIGDHRTSMRLEPSMWDALEDIGGREGLSVNDLCSRIKDRLDEQKRRKGIPVDDREVTLTSAVRVFIAAYYRRASTDDGHDRAGHGSGDPFIGTPFDLPPAVAELLPETGKPSGEQSATPSKTGFPGSGKGGGFSHMAAARQDV
jgi:predicted DNA-binding ribbon-helix-helix protein